jgi:dTMP kinase
MFITFEGLDFCGKTTQAKLLAERLRGLGRVVQSIREPGGTRISESVREILLDRNRRELSPLAELFLFSASRTQLVLEVIVPARRRGEIVICDRYYDSTTAYQGYGRGLDLEAVRMINRIATVGMDPDVTILVEVSVEEIERRKSAAGMTFDRMESSGREFYQRVKDGYIDIAEKERARFVRVDGMAPIETVERTIWHSVEERLARKDFRRIDT